MLERIYSNPKENQKDPKENQKEKIIGNNEEYLGVAEIQKSKEKVAEKETVLTLEQEGAKELFITMIDQNRIDRAKKISEKFSFPKEFIHQVAKEGFIKHLKEGWLDRAIEISEKFSFPKEFIRSPYIQQAVKEKFDKYLRGGQIDLARKTKENFSLIVSPQEIIETSSEVQSLFFKLQKISPEFYKQSLKSVDIAISLFSLAKNSEQTMKIIKNNPFLIDAVSENVRFGSRLLIKYPELDENSKENINFLFNAKQEILEKNSEIDSESDNFRIAMQERLKKYKNNLEILKQVESKGINIERWLNYSETEYFSLNSENSKIAFSETIATPIDRIKEIIASYGYVVKEVINEYRKELQEYKVQTDSVDETSELIKKMKVELSKAKEEGNESKIKGIERGITSFQEKKKKGNKEISLWDKVVGDISSFNKLKNNISLSYENMIKAEEKFEECVQEKSYETIDIIETKKIIAKTKKELKERLDLLEKKIENFRNNFITVLAPALGEDRSESLLQEIHERLGDQFDHYDIDRSTLANLFSERSDKDKEKLNGRPISIFVWARNPDIDLYQGNYSYCCIRIDSEHFGAESTIIRTWEFK